MALWMPNKYYNEHELQSVDNMPYKRLYENLTSEELDELLRCAKHLHWKVLDLSRCGLSDIPDTLEELEDLRVLDIGNTFSSINGDANIFTTLPDSIENLTNLQSLDLSFTPISALPDSVTRLTSLQKLSLSSANISTLPESIGNLTNLRWLYLGGTNISALPESIGNLTNLQSLYLSGTNISALPDSIGNLTNLQSLPLYRTSISALPDSIRNLTNLPELDLSGTNINVLPDFIGNLTNLKSLSLSESLISALPDSIGNLTSLQWLSLSESPISALPDSIGNLTNLQSLYLNGTNISALPDSIGNLKNLQLLYLSETDISMLPDSIGNLKNLRTLYLCSCHLQAIPYDVVTLGLPFVIDDYSSDKDCVNLTGVTLDEGDLQLFAQPQDVIEAYYRKQTQIRECKVIFLGDGGAGKTALIERITQGTFTPETPPTDGIETTNWFMSVEMTKWEDLEGDAPFILRFLDFGGQEIMHAAHRCFLTAHTIYVVVCDSRDDQKIDDIAAYWLQSVNLFAPDCPVILALNKADLNANVSVNERDLKTRNPALKTPYLRTSAKEEPDSRYGVNHLIEAIRDEIPRAVNNYKMNADMLSVKQALETMPDNYISSERYREICAKHHITDKKLQYDMLGFFRDLGVAYYYESKALDTRLESVRVLNPEWLTNGIYRLILRTREDGFLNHKEIKETLRATHAGDVHREITYKPKETEYILHVMRYFEISHDIGGGVEMIPLKMQKTPPSTVDDFQKQDALHLRWEGAYLPNNLIHRLLIRKFPELDRNCVWRTGGHFVQEGGGCEALAEMNEKALNVYVNGERVHCRSYLETFRRVIQAILTDLNLKASEVICCTVDGQEGYIPYEDVVHQYYDKRESIYIPGIHKYVNPAKLLRDTYYNWEQEAARYRQRMERPPVNVNLTVNNNPFVETPDNPLDNEKTRAKIEQIHSETEKNKAETDKIHLVRTAFVGLFMLVAALIVLIVISWSLLPQDLRYEWIGKLVELLLEFRGE